jgi:hypothetical protein
MRLPDLNRGSPLFVAAVFPSFSRAALHLRALSFHLGTILPALYLLCASAAICSSAAQSLSACCCCASAPLLPVFAFAACCLLYLYAAAEILLPAAICYIAASCIQLLLLRIFTQRLSRRWLLLYICCRYR